MRSPALPAALTAAALLASLCLRAAPALAADPPPPSAPPPPSTPPEGADAAAPQAPAAPDDTQGARRDPPREPAPPRAPDPNAIPPGGRFQFGSYGRVMASTDGRGGPGRDADITSHGSRMDEDTYVELELRREDTWKLAPDLDPSTTLMVATLAVGEPLFHYSGKFDAKIAVRNLYLEERGIGDKNLALWVGSRMYRGDDAYLLNWWPLDNLNTVGGGARLNLPSRTELAIHAGVNRLDDPFQHQSSVRALPNNQLGTTQVDVLNRLKMVESFRAEQIFPLGDKAGLKAVAYGELHELPSGQQEREPGRYENLPADSGYVAGLQLGAFTGERDTHVNVFLRYSSGIAAFGGDLAVPNPYALGADKTAKGVHDVSLAFSGNYEAGPFALMAAGYFRSFRGASNAPSSYLNVDEAAVIVRPHVYFGERVGVFVEGTAETLQHGVLDATGSKTLQGSVYRFGIAPFVSPAGRGSYRRPHLRAIWNITRRDEGARSFYATDDVFARRQTEQFLGLEAEWWFNSSYR